MKKTLVYISLFALTGFLVWYFVFKEKDAFGADEAGFTIADTARISKIFLADRRGNAITLQRKDGEWVLNDKYKAINSTVKTLLYTLKSQVAQYPVHKNAYDNVIRMMAGHAVKVELYDEDGDKFKVFYVAGQAQDNAGSYMMMEGSNTPYVVQIPGFLGYISSRYAVDITDWRDRTVFNTPNTNLRRATISYQDEPLNSFALKHINDSSFAVELPKELNNASMQLNKRRALVYSRYFEKVYCEGYINGTIKLDSVIRSVPKKCFIEVEDNKGNVQHADIYWMPVNKRSKNMLTPFLGIDNQYDADRFYAVINDFKDTVIIQRFIFEKFFRKAYEFYEPDDTTSKSYIEIPKGAGNVIKK